MTAGLSPIRASLAALLVLAAGCGGSSVSGASAGSVLQPMVVRVTGAARTTPSTDCFLLLTSEVVGGGTMAYCLQSFTGEPGPNADVKSSGTLTFRLPEGEIRSAVRVDQEFAADGRHAHQRLTGTLTGGTGAYAAATGRVSGGGANVESPPGTIRASDLRYEIDFG